MHQTLSIGDDVSAANCDCAQGSDVEDSKAPSLNGPSTAAVDSGDTLAGKHSPFRVWANRALWTAGLLASLYTFLACLGLMGTSFKVLTGRSAGNLFSSISNPLAAMTVGVMATSALQSSSTTTSIAVALVGADALDIPTAIYIIMGANIGTSVTNTIVAVTQVHNAENFARAVAGATVHDMFNLLTVAILLPVEVLTGYLRRLTEVLVAPVSSSSGNKFTSPIKKWVDPVVKLILVVDKKKVEQAAHGEQVVGSLVKSGLFHDVGMSEGLAGGLGLVLSLIGLMVSLGGLVKLLGLALGEYHKNHVRSVASAAAGTQQGVTQCQSPVARKLQAAAGWLRRLAASNGYVAILLGALMTVAVQSSSVTTSTLTPLVGMGVISLEQMLPLTLGANIGTTTTALLAALASPKVGGIQIALAHLIFNLSGILLWYPVPILREQPLNMARWLSKVVSLWRSAIFIYVGFTFFLLPLMLFAVSEWMGAGVWQTFVSVVLLIALGAMAAGVAYWWRTCGPECQAKLRSKYGRKDEGENPSNNRESAPSPITSESSHDSPAQVEMASVLVDSSDHQRISATMEDARESNVCTAMTETTAGSVESTSDVATASDSDRPQVVINPVATGHDLGVRVDPQEQNASKITPGPSCIDDTADCASEIEACTGNVACVAAEPAAAEPVTCVIDGSGTCRPVDTSASVATSGVVVCSFGARSDAEATTSATADSAESNTVRVNAPTTV